MNEAAERIRNKRLKQPLDELRRKRDKARRRAICAIWTQEEMDYADAWADAWVKELNMKLNAELMMDQDSGLPTGEKHDTSRRSL